MTLFTFPAISCPSLQSWSKGVLGLEPWQSKVEPMILITVPLIQLEKGERSMIGGVDGAPVSHSQDESNTRELPGRTREKGGKQVN